jgi:hypothetical protein
LPIAAARGDPAERGPEIRLELPCVVSPAHFGPV